VGYKKGEEVKVLEIPGCGSVCPFDTFANLYKDIIPHDWDKLCSQKTTSNEQLINNSIVPKNWTKNNLKNSFFSSNLSVNQLK
jgi:hypothetical protein